MIQLSEALGILRVPIPKYDAQTCRWQPQKTSALGCASAVWLTEIQDLYEINKKSGRSLAIRLLKLSSGADA